MREQHKTFDDVKNATIALLASYVDSRSITHRYTDNYGMPRAELKATGFFRDKELTRRRVLNMKTVIFDINRINYKNPESYIQVEKILRRALVINNKLNAEGDVTHRSYEQNKRSGLNRWSAFWNATWTQSRANTVLENALSLIAKESAATRAEQVTVTLGRAVIIL